MIRSHAPLSAPTSPVGINYSASDNAVGVTFAGRAGNDVLVGSNFADTLRGGVGDDFLTGGGGNDTLRGNSGIDTAVFTSGEYNLVIPVGRGVIPESWAPNRRVGNGSEPR